MEKVVLVMDNLNMYNDGKVYVSGNYLDNNDNSKACYWVDGTRKDLPSGTGGLATGIVVVTQ